MNCDQYWPDGPSTVPLVFSLTCKNNGHVYFYSFEDFDPTVEEIIKALIWALLRRSRAVGHETRCSTKSAMRYFQKFLMSIPREHRPQTPIDITEALLRQYGRWLKDLKNLGYRSQASTFRLLSPYFEQWEGQAWAAPDLSVPPFQFPKSNNHYVRPKKGYTSADLKSIAQCVIEDIQATNRERLAELASQWVGIAPPLDDVAPEMPEISSQPLKGLSHEYRVWWWENNCDCKCLDIAEIRGMPGGYAFIFGFWPEGARYLEQARARERLFQFYEKIQAGEKYGSRYLGLPSPIKYSTKWKSPKYLDWIWQNELKKGLVNEKNKDLEKKLYGALKEHHGGCKDFYARNKIMQTLTINDLCPYYIGLLMTTALNPSVIRRLKVDCLLRNPFEKDKDSVQWKKLRANKCGVTVPLKRSSILAPSSIINSLLKITAPYREAGNNYLFCTRLGQARFDNSELTKKGFEKAVKVWFLKKGLTLNEEGVPHSSRHWSSNFRPAAAFHHYQQTGDLEGVKVLLSHSRIETSANYVGKIPEAELIWRRGVHIQALLVGSSVGENRDEAAIKSLSSGKGGLVETISAHCRDIKASPWKGQVKGERCTAMNACLYCQNLVVTLEDIYRFFSMQNFYKMKLSNKEISLHQYEEIIGEKERIFIEFILPKYEIELINNLRVQAKLKPSKEYCL